MVDSSILEKLRVVSQQYNQKRLGVSKRDSCSYGFSQDAAMGPFLMGSQPLSQTASTQVSAKAPLVNGRLPNPVASITPKPPTKVSSFTMTESVAISRLVYSIDPVVIDTHVEHPSSVLDPVLSAIQELRSDIAAWSQCVTNPLPSPPQPATEEEEMLLLSFLFSHDDTLPSDDWVDLSHAPAEVSRPKPLRLFDNPEPGVSSGYRLRQMGVSRPFRRPTEDPTLLLPSDPCPKARTRQGSRKSARLGEAAVMMTKQDHPPARYPEMPLLKRMRVVYTAGAAAH